MQDKEISFSITPNRIKSNWGNRIFSRIKILLGTAACKFDFYISTREMIASSINLWDWWNTWRSKRFYVCNICNVCSIP